MEIIKENKYEYELKLFLDADHPFKIESVPVKGDFIILLQEFLIDYKIPARLIVKEYSVGYEQIYP